MGLAGGEVGVAAGVAKYTGITAAGQQISGAVKNLAWVLIILGGVQFFLRITISGMSSITFALALVLFVLSGYALAQRFQKNSMTITIPMLIFCTWYFIFGASYEPTFLLTFLSITAVLFILPGIITKGESVPAELAGLLPVLFLFLDMGLLPFLIEKMSLPVTSLMQNLVLFMPWWSFFGLLILPNDSQNTTVNGLVNLTRIAGILYIIFVLVAPAVPDLGYQDSLLPSAAEFEEAQANMRNKLPQKENPAWSNLMCVFEGRYNDLQKCINDRQVDSEIKYICTEMEGHKEKSSDYTNCFKEQKEARKNKQIGITGIQDSTIKVPTTAKFIVGKFFPKESQRSMKDEIKTKYPVELKIENPRKQTFEAEMSCNFSQKDNSVPGVIVGNPVIKFSNTLETKPVICEPLQPLNGSYKLVYIAKLKGLETKSRLQRAFIGTKSSRQKEELLPEIMSAHFPGKMYLSQAPAEFARLNFAFGNSFENPVVEGNSNLVLSANIENIGGGDFAKINSYSIDLFGFDVDDPRCINGHDVPLPKLKSSFKSMIYLPTCIIKTIPSELGETDEYVYKEYEGTLNYDYLIKKEVDIKVQMLGS
jgi:hypothetical protein